MSEQRPSNALALDLALTARCPLRCRFCTVDKRPGAELTAAQWARWTESWKTICFRSAFVSTP